MNDLMTAVARILAQENGATLTVTNGFACDLTNPVLVRLGEDLGPRLAAAGIDLLALRLEGDCLVARIDEQNAEEDLCPNAFRRVVQNLSYRLCGRAFDARIELATPAPHRLVPAL